MRGDSPEYLRWLRRRAEAERRRQAFIAVIMVYEAGIILGLIILLVRYFYLK